MCSDVDSYGYSQLRQIGCHEWFPAERLPIIRRWNNSFELGSQLISESYIFHGNARYFVASSVNTDFREIRIESIFLSTEIRLLIAICLKIPLDIMVRITRAAVHFSEEQVVVLTLNRAPQLLASPSPATQLSCPTNLHTCQDSHSRSTCVLTGFATRTVQKGSGIIHETSMLKWICEFLLL